TRFERTRTGRRRGKTDVTRGHLARHFSLEGDSVTPDLDLCDRDGCVPGQLLGPGTLSQLALSGDRTNDWLLLHVCGLDLRLHTRAAAGTHGRLAWGNETLSSRTFTARAWCRGDVAIAQLVGAGNRSRFDSPRNGLHVSVCDGTTVPRDQSERTRALYGNATDVRRSRARDCTAILWLVLR